MKVEMTNAQGAMPAPKILVYGRSGIGKTRLCATAPKPIILSAEEGLLSLRREAVPFIRITTIDDLTAAYTFVKNSPTYYTICLDSISEIAETVLANAKVGKKDGRMAYGDMIEQVICIIKSYRDLPGKATVMTAKASFNKDAFSGVTKWGPSVPGARLAQELPYLYDEVFALCPGMMPTGEEYVYLRTKADLQYEAKDRSGSLAEQEQPNLTAVFSKMLGL